MFGGGRAGSSVRAESTESTERTGSTGRAVRAGSRLRSEHSLIPIEIHIVDIFRLGVEVGFEIEILSGYAVE